MSDDDLMQKAIRQENAKARLLMATAEAVVKILQDFRRMPTTERQLLELIEELKEANRA